MSGGMVDENRIEMIEKGYRGFDRCGIPFCLWEAWVAHHALEGPDA